MVGLPEAYVYREEGVDENEKEGVQLILEELADANDALFLLGPFELVIGSA